MLLHRINQPWSLKVSLVYFWCCFRWRACTKYSRKRKIPLNCLGRGNTVMISSGEVTITFCMPVNLTHILQGIDQTKSQCKSNFNNWKLSNKLSLYKQQCTAMNKHHSPWNPHAAWKCIDLNRDLPSSFTIPITLGAEWNCLFDHTFQRVLNNNSMHQNELELIHINVSS